MKDYIVRATAANNKIRAFAVNSREMVEEARQAHNTTPVASAALGRLLTAGSMMGAMLKGEKDILTLQVKGSGPIGGITVTADEKANVKGYVNNAQVDLPLNSKGKLDVAEAVGLGIMNIIKDIGLKDPYVGQTHLVTSEIAEDLTYYFANSEQTPSSVALGVLVDKDYSIKQAGGFIIQLLPDADEEVIDKLEKAIQNMESMTTLLDQGKTPEDILEILLGDMELKILEKVPTKFQCDCTRERVEKALISVGRKDIEEMIEEGEDIELNCHFCSSKYIFTPEDLKKLI